MSFKIATLALLPALSWAQDSEQKPVEPTETRPQLERVCSAGHINGGETATTHVTPASVHPGEQYASHAPQPVLDQNGNRVGVFYPE